MNFNAHGSNQIFYNPRISVDEKNILFSLKEGFESEYQKIGYFLVPSSGSSKSTVESVKLVALKTESILNSARRFNQYFQLQDATWGLVLPKFHIAGISIYARAFLSRSQVVESAWNVENFREWLINHNVTHLSLVPTQIFDILKEEIECPPQVQMVLIGGARLNSLDKIKMSGLGWPCYETYGMTETASLIAVRGPTDDFFKLLPEVKIKIEEEVLKIKCDSLLTCYIQKQGNEIRIQKGLDEQGYLKTEDQVKVHGEKIEFLGRITDFVKINGEGVSLSKLRDQLQQIDHQSTLLAELDSRSGYKIILVTEVKNHHSIQDKFNQIVKPYERIKKVVYLEKIPRTELGKIKVNELMTLIKKDSK